MMRFLEMSGDRIFVAPLDSEQKKCGKNVKKISKIFWGYRKGCYICIIKLKNKPELMKTNTYDIISREIETVYPKYITPAYYYKRFPLIREVIIDGEEVELYGYIEREDENLVATIENIGYDRCAEPLRFEYQVYDEED